MPSPFAERAVADCFQYERALLKFLSANDVRATGSHQHGPLLPVRLHNLFTVHSPEKGVNRKHDIAITWQDGRITESVVTWYGKAKREYRLTRFGRDFPFLNPDMVGALFVLIPRSQHDFLAYEFETEEDIEYVQATLGVEVVENGAAYDRNAVDSESDEDCIKRLFREFAAANSDFPTGIVFSNYTWDSLIECVENFESQTADSKIVRLIQEEYNLFRLTERKICEPQIHRMFASVDEFVATANSILNRRKSRAGRSLENHLDRVFQSAGIPFEMRPNDIDGKPDVVVPGAKEYFDETFPTEKLFIIGVKTTCKDRWRQVLNEGKRKEEKHLITMQQGISKNQLNEMVAASVQLVVPKTLHRQYPKDSRMKLMGINDLISNIKSVYG